MKKLSNLLAVLLSIYHYQKGSMRLPYLPTALWIEPTNICNLRCIMCPNSIVTQKNPGYMDWSVYQRIVDEVKHFAAYVVLCISGESLLHPRFPQMVAYAKQNGVATYISTNATNLTPKLSRQLLRAGLDWINFSFDGCSKQTYERIRVGARFEKTLNNIVNFLVLKRDLGAKTHAELQIIITDEEGKRDYEKNIDKFRTVFDDLPLNYIQARLPSTWGGLSAKTNKFQPKKLGKTFSPCSYLWSSLHILWDGRVVACTSDFFGENVLGKFPNKTLTEIWNDKPMLGFRKAMLTNKYLKFNHNCRGCDTIWEPRVFGLPSGIRGICAATISSIVGKNYFEVFKRLAKLTNQSFAMDVLPKKIIDKR